MHPIDHYETIRRGHEELLKRAEYQRMARKAMREQMTSRNIHKAANWLGMRLVSWGEKLEKFGAFAKRQSNSSTTTRLRIRPLSKLGPHH